MSTIIERSKGQPRRAKKQVKRTEPSFIPILPKPKITTKMRMQDNLRKKNGIEDSTSLGSMMNILNSDDPNPIGTIIKSFVNPPEDTNPLTI